MLFGWVFLVIAFVTLQFARAKVKLPKPEWGTSYKVEGTIHIPDAEVEEHFAAWIDKINNRSRVDFNEGLVQTYQIANCDNGKFGTLKRFYQNPIGAKGEIFCDVLLGTNESVVLPQGAIPNLATYKLTGKKLLKGNEIQKWQVDIILEEKTFQKVMYVTWKQYSSTNMQKYPVPVKFEVTVINNILNVVTDSYYIVYENFKLCSIDKKIFIHDKKKRCNNFYGLQKNHVGTLNPIRAFVQPVLSVHVVNAFDKFMRECQVRYADKEMKVKKFKIFCDNYRFIMSNNRKCLGYSLKINCLTDQTKIDMINRGGVIFTPGSNNAHKFPYTKSDFKKLPAQLDLRLIGGVNSVKDQGTCGSSYAFVASGVLESAYFASSGRLEKFSEKSILDCTFNKIGMDGCKGGSVHNTFEWMKKKQGVPVVENYGNYIPEVSYCHPFVPRATVKQYFNVTSNSKEALKFALIKHGAIALSIDASPRTFTFYENGVYDDSQCKSTLHKLNHAVLLVGYGKRNGKDYWLVKNSWSENWGSNGYMFISMSKNYCGVMTNPMYVELK